VTFFQSASLIFSNVAFASRPLPRELLPEAMRLGGGRALAEQEEMGLE
jgi:hypothetical protein